LWILFNETAMTQDTYS